MKNVLFVFAQLVSKFSFFFVNSLFFSFSSVNFDLHFTVARARGPTQNSRNWRVNKIDTFFFPLSLSLSLSLTNKLVPIILASLICLELFDF